MRTLHLYLTRQILATLGMTVLVFTFVLVLANVLREILTLLISGEASLLGVAEAFGLLFPWVLAFALPMGMLTAALLVFGRLSADQELTAVRSSGISLLSLISPVLVLSVLLCGLSAWVNMSLAPRCRVAYKNLTTAMGLKVAASLIPEGHAVTIGNWTVLVSRVNGDQLEGVRVGGTKLTNYGSILIEAPRGRLMMSNNQAILLLYDTVGCQSESGSNWNTFSFGQYPVPLGPLPTLPVGKKPEISDMTFPQLQAELREREELNRQPIADLTVDEAEKMKTVLESLTIDPTLPVRVQMHRQVALSFACLGFTLVGIPLGIRAHRRETNVGFLMALLLVALYYSFIIMGQSLQTRADWAPYLIMWVPNFIFQAVGAVMLWRANRGV